MRAPKVVIIITNYNGLTIKYRGKGIIDRCLSSMKKTKYGNYKVVVVDDNSTDNSIAYISGKFKNVALLKNKTNCGFSKGNNGGIVFAIKEYNPEYIMLLNNDTIINDPNWLNSMVKVAESKNEIGIVGCKMVFPNGIIQHMGFKEEFGLTDIAGKEEDNVQLNSVREVAAFSGAVFLIKRGVIDRIGLLDANFGNGHEDLDYCKRARDAGFKVVCDGKAKIIHLGSFSVGNVKGYTKLNKDRFYVLQRNAAYFAMKHLGAKDRAAVLSRTFGAGLITVEDAGGSRKITNLKLKEKPLSRVHTAFRAYADAYKLSRQRKHPEADYKKGQFIVVRR